MMRLLFLDIDGVLNSRQWFDRNVTGGSMYGSTGDREIDHLDPSACATIDEIVRMFDLSVVVSSSWRILHTIEEIRGFLVARDAPRAAAAIIGATRRSHRGRRGHEIAEYLHELVGPHPTGMAIVDDDSDMFELSPWLVKTRNETGLLVSHAEDVARTLERPMPSRDLLASMAHYYRTGEPLAAGKDGG